ncbi:GGDEF domain-containing protein [uncultured Ruminococcus sp.]|uniref:GGDEF domain-containing protein n=1 Tax=uncultured Ruminococcus sp. TaxID=165186 RepID=UPI002615A7FF|nr:GGDEF domain-containing protein [uncultured Ruminococcus sp.]
MAKDKNNASYQSRAYTFGAILLAVVVLANMALVAFLSRTNSKISTKTSSTMSAVNRMNTELLIVNGNVLRIVSQMSSDTDAIVVDTQLAFTNIYNAMADFEEIDGKSDDVERRYNSAKAFIKLYEDKLNSALQKFKDQEAKAAGTGLEAFGGDYRNLYVQDLYPLQVTASEMLEATIDIANKDAAAQGARIVKVFILVEALMLIFLILGEIAIMFIAKMAKKARIDLEEREKSLREVDAKLKSTRQKASDLALTNILTGMKNRYALDEDISGRLESDRFNIAVFDMDNFRSINDTYGYDFGDEYLIAVADRLKNEFSGSAEIYNITGNEFCFVFNKEISESQAMGIVQNIHAVMCSPYDVLNLTVQLPTSGSVYHYLPGDCLNVNSLLVKLDTALRNAKLNGGNMINTVVDI